MSKKPTSKFLAYTLVLSTTAGIWFTAAATDDTPTLYASKSYVVPGQVVRYYEPDGNGKFRVAHFKNKWFASAEDKPSFETNAGAWERITPIFSHTNQTDLTAIVQAPALEQWNAAGIYVGGNVVQHSGSCYKAKWWTQNNSPSSSGSPWESTACPSPVSQTLIAVNMASNTTESTEPANTTTTVSPTVQNNCGGDGSNIPVWNKAGVYTEGMVIKIGTVYYKSKWWNQDSDPGQSVTNPWDSPWQKLPAGCIPKEAKVNIASNETQTNEQSNVNPAPADDTDTAQKNTENTNTPAKPAVVVDDVSNESVSPSTPVPTALPATGYAFLRQVTTTDWDWLFPLRSGKKVSTNPCVGAAFQNCGGASRNAENSGLEDVFTLDNFVKSVLAYNHWAAANGYKQFLNEGTAKQQAEEFVAFWAKSSRETSGSWNNAPSPWIVNHTLGGEAVTAWKGGLYWVEEVGYTTKPDGSSVAIGYVDAASSYQPEPGRSYHGRGIIQLSWNYNYGAFSEWMFNNGMFTDIIKSKRALLVKPNLVADDGRLAFMSGIWFWMTPQGAKPASQDVLLGAVTKISSSTQDQGLPKTNTGYTPKVASGETSDPEVMAYRIGTVINIVNGGLECNKAAVWHGGPVQRVFYYDAYAAYFNSKYNIGITRLPNAKASNGDVWNTKVGANSHIELQSATCYNQKSYYGW